MNYKTIFYGKFYSNWKDVVLVNVREKKNGKETRRT
jgi:hypothetical protein